MNSGILIKIQGFVCLTDLAAPCSEAIKWYDAKVKTFFIHTGGGVWVMLVQVDKW